jgi:hypothetical protein
MFRLDSARWDAALQFPDYLATVVKHAELWQGVYRMATVSPESIERLRQAPGEWRLLALSEDWCGDCVSCLPVIARLTERSGIELRVLGRDANPEIMDAHLSSGARSIPVVMILDTELHRHGWWGPRPSPVQRWMRNEGLLLPKPEQSRRKRAWYARDRGRTVAAEMAEAIERAARRAELGARQA